MFRDGMRISRNPDHRSILDRVAEPEKTKQSVEERVMEWLRTGEGDAVLEFSFCSADKEHWDLLLFSRATIHVKTCANCWDVWRIATSSSWPNMLSYRVMAISDNSFWTSSQPKKNEVRGENYSPSTDKPDTEDNPECLALIMDAEEQCSKMMMSGEMDPDLAQNLCREYCNKIRYEFEKERDLASLTPKQREIYDQTLLRRLTKMDEKVAKGQFPRSLLGNVHHHSYCMLEAQREVL